MNETSETSPPPTCAALPSTTSSPASASGPTPCDKQGGPTTDQCGPAPVRASLSARQASERGLLTSGTYGRPGIGSSESFDLKSSLVSRLRPLTASLGSTMFRQTWRVKATPAGRSYFQLVVSVPRTSDQGSGSWPTPVVSRGDYQKSRGKKFLKLEGAAKLSGWATPVATEIGNTLENYLAMKANMKSGKRTAVTHPSIQAQLASWATPMASRRETTAKVYKRGNPNLAGQALLTEDGETPSGCSVETASGAQLNPAHSRWLMGLPREWDSCGATAMRSLPKPQRRSSRRTKKSEGSDGLR